FDTYLMLRGPDDVSADNDDGPDGTNSRIDMVLSADGDYTVSVTSYGPGEVGPYSLTAGLSMGTPRQAGVRGGPRVFAIMVGISDYGGYSSDLAYTADDALKLAEALRREGVLNPASVVLTDAEATVGGVRRAFAEVAAQAGPDDIFLFFFSGHGSQQSVAVSGNELDGLAETIVLRDGQITDAEMSELFASLDTRLSLIVLDSCFSGGFARNVVNRPGVIGLFSSEEDLTSQVAVKFQAGGYLSHFLRTGLTGEANYDGDDLITAGELTTYLRRKFASEVMDVQTRTIDGQRSYQHLVVERGGVQVDDVVIRIGRG
ncbi:MAG: caspase family protein, partial [Brevundimonas sp.]|uniref:caspase family protein n=1 Tax=Brevundimonas sp. TaxID=1871086 RepID=UPI0027323D7A